MRMIMAEALVQLMTWLSPSFPTGGFAYSHGLEWAVEAGAVADGPALRTWLEAALVAGAARNDAILLRHAYRSHAYRGDDEAVLAEIAQALAPSRELAAETMQQGAAFGLASAPWNEAAAPSRAYPLAVGRLAAHRGIDEEMVVLAYLQAWVANFVSAGVRLIPLGQNAGLAVQAALEPVIIAQARASRDAPLTALGGFCVAAEIASMRHETQYTRLFRS
ncbi:urease accessory protein [Acidiphilium sp. MT5]